MLSQVVAMTNARLMFSSLGAIMIKYPDLVKPYFWVLDTFQSSGDTRCDSKWAPGDLEFHTHFNSFYTAFGLTSEQIASQQTAELPCK